MEKLLLQVRKASNLVLFFCLLLASVILSFLIAKIGVAMALLTILAVIGLSIVIITFSNYKYGFIILVVYSYFIFHIGRFLPFHFPLGVFMEFFYVLITFSIVIKGYRNNEKNQWAVFKNPVGYAILFYVGYALFEMFNPNSSALAPRILAFRELGALVLMFFIAMHVFTSLNYVLFFTKFWLFFALLVALYAMHQEYVGLLEFERKWLYETPERYNLVFIWGHLRKWSFLSDVSAYGLFAAYSGIVCGILALGPFAMKQRIILGVSSLIMFVAMSYSGTRTATAMVLIGMVFYILLTINTRRTIIFATFSALALVGLLYGPFYGSTLTRMRSTFDGSEDPSMGVRNGKRAWLQPYAREHPMGGGINTVGTTGANLEPGHPMAGPFDPDSGYLRMALERGWLGLLVNLGYYAAILIWGVKKYFEVTNQKIKILYAAYMAGFFALSVAHFAQDAMDQKPIFVIILCSFAIFAKLDEFDKVETNIV